MKLNAFMKNSIDEIGCVHTIQGYDINFTEVIFSNEITYNEESKIIEIIEENYHGRNRKRTIKSK